MRLMYVRADRRLHRPTRLLHQRLRRLRKMGEISPIHMGGANVQAESSGGVSTSVHFGLSPGRSIGGTGSYSVRLGQR
jgi:hypothetical protein